VTATDRTRIPRPAGPRWGVVCGDDDVVWARDEAAARRLLTSLVGASRIVRQDMGDADTGAQESGGP
jgi:hypothetical protein